MELVKPAYAQIETSGSYDIATLRGFEGVFSSIVGVALGFAGIALFIMLLVGGFRYLTSGGNPQQAEAAQKTITTAILGVVVVALTYLILSIIAEVTGANIETFQIYRP